VRRWLRKPVLVPSAARINARTVIRKIVLFAPFQAFVLALLPMPFEYQIWLDDLLRRLGATLVPIALVSVDYQLHLSQVRGRALVGSRPARGMDRGLGGRRRA
jgi:predicted permease